MEDERFVKVQEIKNCIGSVGEEKHENLPMQPEVISDSAIHAIKETYEEFHPTFIASRGTVSYPDTE
jgi:hypothetical protein